MELTPRKQAVLKAVVKAYIETGEPIGSKILTELLENAPSSATLRNEMSELCSLGLLEQPHTSAGRVPTVGGYRLYIDSLMSCDSISDSTKKYIDENFASLHCEPELIPSFAAKILSELTGLPAFCCTISNRVPEIKRIELLPVSRFSVMLLVITDDGRARNKIFRQSSDFTSGTKRLFEDISKKYLIGRPINNLNPGYIQSIAATAGMMVLELIPLLNAVCNIVSDINIKDVNIENGNALYSICDSEREAHRIMSMLRNSETLISLLANLKDESGVIFGIDTGYEELWRKTLVSAKFSIADKYSGYIGVLGPNRMSYDQILPCTQYITEKLGETMTEAQRNMED